MLPILLRWHDVDVVHAFSEQISELEGVVLSISVVVMISAAPRDEEKELLRKFSFVKGFLRKFPKSAEEMSAELHEVVDVQSPPSP